MTEQKKSEIKRDEERQAGADAASAEPVPGTAYQAPPRAEPRANGAQAVQDAGASAMGATRNVLRGAIGTTEDVASGLVGGVTHVATDIVHGVHDIGLEVRDGATGLIGAVGVVGGAAVNTVAHLLADVVGGVRYVVGAALPHNGDGHARRDEALRHEPDELAAAGRVAPPSVVASGRDSGTGAPM